MIAQIASTALPPHRSSPPVPPVFPVAPPDFIHAFNHSVGQLDISDGSARLLELLLSFDLPDPRNGKERKGFVWPSRSTLAENLNVTERTIRKRLRELRDAGILEDLTTGELRQLRNKGHTVPDAGRGGGWKINYDQLPDFQLNEEGGFHPARKGDSTQGGRIVPPPYTESGKTESRKENHHQSSVTSTTSDNDGGGDVSPLPPETEPSIPRSEESKELQIALLGWKVSRPIADRIVLQVTSEVIRQALTLLERNRALPREKRVIVNPPAWLCYTLTISDNPQLDEWERRIAAMEEESIAPAPTSWTVQIEELLPKEQETPTTAATAPIETPSIEATIALAALEVEIQEEAPADIAQVIEESFSQAEAETTPVDTCGKEDEAVPVFDVQVETDDQPGTTVSIDCGVKQIEIRYDHLPEVPPEETMNLYDPERSMPDSEPVETEVATPEPEATVQEDPNPNGAMTVSSVGVLDEPMSHDDKNCSHESLHMWEETQPGFTPSDQSEEKMLSPTPPHQPWHLNQADCERLWQEIQAQLEEEQQGIPLLDQVTLRWKGDGVVLQAPGRAIAWALENRVNRIQCLLQNLTGQALDLQVLADPGGGEREDPGPPSERAVPGPQTPFLAPF